MFILSIVCSIFSAAFVVLLSNVTLTILKTLQQAIIPFIKSQNLPVSELVLSFVNDLISFKDYNLSHVLLLSVVISVLALKRELCGSCGTPSNSAQSGSRKVK
ncbi:hypothetical protein DICPUDRAFT_93302 [Dictyostelium purpureum]|uniref:Uncharacterized protein n=1 Tax=Dictyostelium purpureum TaxID=5786 RepID=F1A5D3_DICPU|nr:uncharacterized protein DICPUDRAFT_93302 [Dictyostelium purpureum]EGC28597.1 hypothetical protein DICPUDRAFT_93302 [Dictyostelium purpureum]|eukprot:XP_003294877.1 hypothetical protein DICPUDRAFT_93302 [Dictyostelium purpureum]